MIKKTCFLPLLLALLPLLCSKPANAQFLAPRFSIHASNPVGLFEKVGFKAQFRLSQENSFLVGYRYYWNFFPGYQASMEYHRYFQTWDPHEGFIYGKMGIGKAGYQPRNYYAGWQDAYTAPGNYIFAGAGVGKRYNISHFFIEVNLGLKLAQTTDKKNTTYNKNIFYALGPGSFVDFNLNFGYQFYKESRQLYLKRVRSRWHGRYD